MHDVDFLAGRVERLIQRIRLAIGCGSSLQDIHDTIVYGSGEPVSERDFYLAFQAAKLLSRSHRIIT